MIMEKFKEDLEKHLDSEYEKRKEQGIENNYSSGYLGAVIGLINWIKEYEFNH